MEFHCRYCKKLVCKAFRVTGFEKQKWHERRCKDNPKRVK